MGRLIYTLFYSSLVLSALTAHAATLEISGRHTLSVTEQTLIMIGDEQVPLNQAQIDAGMKVEVLIAGPQIADDQRGAGLPAAALIFDFDLRGPVTGQNPLQVLGQDLSVIGDTQLNGINSAADLEPGDMVVISGQFDINGSLIASLIERLPSSPTSWRIAGYVSATGADMLNIGNQQLQYAGVVPLDCDGGPNAGDHVIARADPIADFQPGQPIDTVTRLRCATPVPPGTPGAAGGLEGVINALTGPSQFDLGGLLVEFDAATVFLNGSVDDLAVGAMIELEGTYITATSVLANVIEMVHPVVRLQAPFTPADVTPGVSLGALGLEFLISPQVRDEDGIAANGLSQPTQVEIRGYVDALGQLFAQRVRERGAPDINDHRLRGPVTQISRPQFDILNLTIDTSSSLFEDEFGNPLSADDFFALLTTDSIADIGGAQFDGPSNTLSGGIVLYIGPAGAAQQRGPSTDTTLFGTVTQGFAAVTLFADGFE
ncbi:MAG: hypothetical protein Tsb002_21840 [Wenzhouxiangellaceae bacterium]